MKINILLISILFILSLFTGFAFAELAEDPTGLTAAVSGSYVNHSWLAGSGNVTDAYNVSLNGVWDNSSSVTYTNDNVGENNYAEIYVYAYNNTGSGNLSSGYLYANTRADRSTLGDMIDLMEVVPNIIRPIADLVAEMIVIAAYIAVAGLIVAVVGGIVLWINKSFGGFKLK